MKKNLYYRSLMRRENTIRKFFLSLFTFFASGARLLLEVFIRKGFGERYFKLSAAVILTVEFGLLPFLLVFLQRKVGAVLAATPIGSAWNDETIGEELYTPTPHAEPSVWAGYTVWYLFLTAFILISIKHHLDQKREPSVFDFEKFSLYGGSLQSYMLKIPFFKTEDSRFRECIVEPLFFMAIGFVLILFHQYVGWLLVICSIFYSVSYISAYEAGDNFVMDRIDEIISNQEMEKSFVDGVDADDTRGFEFRGRRPESEEYRRALLPSIMTDDEDTLVAT